MQSNDTPSSDTKACTKCGETKPLQGFPRRKDSRDGFDARCHACKAVYMAAWSAKNTESVAASQRAYREANRESRRAYNRDYRLSHLDELKAKSSARYAANQERALRKAAEYRAANRETIRRKKKEFTEANREHVKAQRTASRLRMRALVMKHYGGTHPVCACCGESTPGFLTIDHIGGGGNIHRREIGESELSRWLIKNDYPEGFRILCFNCNWADGIYGRCPHADPSAGNFTLVPPRSIQSQRPPLEDAPAEAPSGPEQEVAELAG